MVKILILKNLVVDYTWLSDHGPVVRKPINADPRLKVNAGFTSLIENVLKANFKPKVKKTLIKN